MTMKTLYCIILFIGGFYFSQAQQLVYKPINPAFGGESFNYSWLMSSAAAQNQFDASKNKNPYDNRMDSSLNNFSDSMNRQLLSEISRKLFNDTLGDGPLKAGKYMYGNLFLT